MRAVQFEEFGTAGVFSAKELPDPNPSRGHSVFTQSDLGIMPHGSDATSREQSRATSRLLP
jgi:hypothetical protein